MLNEYYFVGRNKRETVICRIDDDSSAHLIPTEQFKLEVAHIRVYVNGKLVPAEKYWRESPDRHERELVFKPGRLAEPHEYNLWRGFGVELRQGWQKQRRLLRHLRRVICRRDKDKFKYLMRLLAWFVQNPDEHAGVVLVLKSREQGTGKSTVGKVVLDIFGRHGVLVDDKDRLLGRFTDWLETTCFVLAEEILFAGDLKAADKMKSMITDDQLQIKRKFGSCRVIPNRLKAIATTNHDHAIAAGVRDRRYIVYDVSNEHVGDKEWFDALYRDRADGGTSEFLWLLTHLQLGSWHPRRCAGFIFRPFQSICRLLQAKWSRALPSEIFGKACADMFGPRKRLRAFGAAASGTSKRRPWGYHVPKGTKWQEKVDLGVTN